MRLIILRREPICQDPFRTGCKAPATQADHIIPKWAGGTDSIENGEGLCESDHGLKTRIEQGIIFEHATSEIPTLCTVYGNTVTLYSSENAPSYAVSIKEWPHLIESIQLTGRIA